MNVSWDYSQGTAAGEPGVVIDPAGLRTGELADPARIRALVFGDHDVDGAEPPRIMNLGYVPGRELRVVYRLPHPTGERIARVDLYPPGEGTARAARAARRARDPALIRPLPEWDAVVRHLPEDERLPGLGMLTDPAGVAALLGDALGRPVDPAGLAVRLLAYVPRRRAVVRVDGSVSAVGKLGRMRDEGDCHLRQVALHDLPGRRFALPRPLGAAAAAGVRFEEVVVGRAVEDVVSARGVGPVLDAAAAAAVALHAVPALAGLPRIGALDLLAHLEGKTLGRLCATLPRLAPRMDRLAVALRDAPPRAGREVMLHGDFHPANLMFTEAGPVFVDLDNLSVGPPERDLAIFAGRMALFAIRDGDGDRAVREALTLPERYRMAGGGGLDDRAFAWFVAASVLVRQLSNGVRRLAPGLPVIAERLLDLADEVLAAAR